MLKRVLLITSIKLPINRANVIAGVIIMPRIRFEHPEYFGKNWSKSAKSLIFCRRSYIVASRLPHLAAHCGTKTGYHDWFKIRHE